MDKEVEPVILYQVFVHFAYSLIIKCLKMCEIYLNMCLYPKKMTVQKCK